ncbi:MAG: AmmeMemoRadiSam system protein A [Spirochaetaceae bacterium]|jgi:AmmeMemoRadiSam system protein A|nr:AmmeMemoRadiSam system protein A [Spirochaetaceae bacterium]
MNNGENSESIHVQLARKTVELFAREGAYYTPDFPLPEDMAERKAGVFVSIHKKNGDLRGCIGTIAPVQKNIVYEIIHNAISASNEDSRFPPVNAGELSELAYSVDVLEAPEPVTSEQELDPQKYGVIVSLDFRRGLLLPALEGVTSASEQISIAMRKAGIPLSERPHIKLKRFTVTRYH